MNSFLIANYVLLLFGCVQNVYGENILYVAAIASPSHHIWNRALAFGLVKEGHNVTHIALDQDDLPKPQNYTHILIEGVYDELHAEMDINEMADNGPLQMMVEFENWCIYQCQLILRSKGLQTLLDYPTNFKFDLVIFDVTAGSCVYPLIKKFNYPPTVAVSAFLLPSYISYSFGNNLFPSYLPFYALPYSTEMNFMERVFNFLYTYIDLGLRHAYQYKEEHKLAKKVFGEDIPPMEHFERHMSLALVNTDPILDYPQPIPPNIISVGGLHTRKSKEIPKGYKKILDNAKNGVVIMSLGTNVRSDKLPRETQQAILDAFSKLSETVIWKFESDITDLPKNVIIQKWLPQNDILGHPNVKLFIGHGGALSTQETIYHGVPTILIPFIVDQYINSKIIVNKQLGLQVDFKKITTENFLKSLREVLDNPIYAKNMKTFSDLYKDRKETALERGIFWIEYVMRHKGAHFLNTTGRNLTFFAQTGFDVILFLIAIASVFIILLFKLILFVLKLFTKNKKVKVQ